MIQRRREFLTSVALVGIAGCSSSGGSNSEGGGGGSDPSTPISEKVLDDTVTVLEDEWTYWEFDVEESLELSYEFLVRDGPPVDLIILTQDEFTSFENEERFRYFDGSSLDSTGSSESLRLDPADMVIVIDNSELGEAEPPTNFDEDPAEVEITVTLTRG